MTVSYRSFSPIEKIELPKEIEYGEVELSDIVKQVFEFKGITRLYKHQADAIKLVREGKNIVVSSPTASGKTEVYLSEIVDAALKRQNSLILYPTKALSRDQLKKFQNFSLYGIDVKIYDGDTPDYQRKKIRDNNPRILITNVDMLHHILMNNRAFKCFFKNLKFVVIDEAHSYSGILGSHTANIFWRLKRICENKLQFILTSATVKNPKYFCGELIQEPVEEIRGSSTKHAKIKHLMISEEHQSYITTTLEFIRGLNKKSLIFGNSHSVVERLSFFGQQANIPIKVYRSGLTYDKRKELENEFKKGKINYLATTSALELGLDIGDVDAVVLAGYPGTITRVRQRIGRAGREGQEALAVFIAKENPLDQYYIDNPDDYLNGSPESCFINPENSKIKRTHILAAARDKLLNKTEIENFQEEIKKLEDKGLIKKWANFYSPTHNAIPILNSLNLRGIGETLKIYDSGSEKLVGERELSIGLGELFEGAIYLHAGRPYVSEELNLKDKKVYISPITRELNEFTFPLSNKDISIVEELEKREISDFPISFGKIHVIKSIYGFRIKDSQRGTVLGENTFKEPYSTEYDSYSFWIDLEALSHNIEDFGSGLHAFEHITISMVPALVGCDVKELGGLSYPSGTVFIFDSLPEGSGITSQVFKNFEEICTMAYDRLTKCKCDSGCPKCIFDPSCGNDNRFLNKNSANEILRAVLSVK